MKYFKSLMVALSLGMTSPGYAALDVISGDTLRTGEAFYVGDTLVSKNGKYTMQIQPEGNLVVTTQGETVWETRTSSNSVGRLLVRGDGNVVLYDKNANTLWYTDTYKTGNKNRLVLTNWGSLDVVTKENKRVWSSSPANTLKAGDTLYGGQALVSKNGEYVLRMSEAGNLRLYAENRVLWRVVTKQPGSLLSMQTDGNLVLYNSNWQPEWSAQGTWGTGEKNRLVLTDLGDLQVYTSEGRKVWSAGSGLPNGWTKWLNSGYQGPGDDESIDRFDKFEVCENPTRIEARFAGYKTYTPGSGLDLFSRLEYFNAEQGLKCISGRPACQDFEVRFYCPKRENLVDAFPILEQGHAQNEEYSYKTQALKTSKRLDPPRFKTNAKVKRAKPNTDDFPVTESIARLGQGYDSLTDVYREECLDQSHPDFNAEIVPPTSAASSGLEYINTRKELYRQLSVNTNLGVDIGFEIKETEIELGVGYSSNILKDEYFEHGREVFVYKFQKPLRKYLLNTQPRPIKPEYSEGDGIHDPYLEAPDPHNGMDNSNENAKQNFHKECGDKFLGGAELGGRLFIVFHYDSKNYSESEGSGTRVGVQLAIEDILDIGTSQDEVGIHSSTLESANVKFDIYSYGGPAVTAVSYKDLHGIVEKYEAGLTLANAYAMEEEFRSYPMPAAFNDYAYYDIFPDIRDYLFNGQKWATVVNEYSARCATLDSYKEILGANFDNGFCQSEGLIPDLEIGLGNCVIPHNWEDCVHPVNATNVNHIPLLDRLGQEIKGFESTTVIGDYRNQTRSTPLFGGRQCTEFNKVDTSACLPSNCWENLPAGEDDFGVGQGFGIKRYDYHSPSKSGDYPSEFSITTHENKRCVRPKVKACTKRSGPSKAHLRFEAEIYGVCSVEKPFPLD